MEKLNGTVVTGPVGSGKTTVLAAASRTVRIVPEVARELIERELVAGGTLLPWLNFDSFEIAVHNENVHRFVSLPREGTFLFDRGIPDAIAFCRWYGAEVPNRILDHSKQLRYNPRVLFFPPWQEIYRSEAARPTTYREAARLSQILEAVYSELGYELVKVPRLPVSERTAFVRDYIAGLVPTAGPDRPARNVAPGMNHRGAIPPDRRGNGNEAWQEGLSQ